MADIVIHALTPDRFPDLAALFEEGGDPKWCWYQSQVGDSPSDLPFRGYWVSIRFATGPHQYALAVTTQPKLLQIAPELVAYINAGLMEQGESALIPTVNVLVIHAIEMSGSHVSLDTVGDLDGRAMMEDPRRNRLWIGRPRGVRRRSWSITLEVIEGEIWHVGLSHPGILRPTFQRVAREIGAARA